MAKLIEYRRIIMDSNPYQQVIWLSLHPPKWENLNDDIVNDVLNELDIQQGKRVITRNDVRNTEGKHQIIKAMMWTFADNPDLRIVHSVISHIDEIVVVLDLKGNKNLQKNEYKDLYNTLDVIEYVGMTTASVLFFFSQLKCEGNHSIAVTRQIKPHFSDFEELACLVEENDFVKIIERINEVARDIDVSTEQLEYFLYRINKGEITII
ncbi:MAG: hypothetical protein K5864_04515 [Bacteroidales bacterium]|nr:hypothetical protein [Bacteroidales bacterium]